MAFKLTKKESDIVDAAGKGMKKAHVVWQNSFPVGAAVIVPNGRIYYGCNIETRFSGLGVCAERCAIDNAISQGETSITKIAILFPAETFREPRPCGACLQYIHDFSKGNAKVIMAKMSKEQDSPKVFDVKFIWEMLTKGNTFVESLETLAKDSKSTLIEYLANHAEYVRFFSYGSNMNRKKFRKDMEKAAKDLGLKLTNKDKTKLELDKNSVKRILWDFKRDLSNESEKHGRAFSICGSFGSMVEGICHNVHVSVLPAFLKKEGLLSSKGEPSYKLIKVCVSSEDQEVLTLLGLKPKSIECIKPKKIQDASKYVDDSIEGAEDFDVEHSDMQKVRELLVSLQTLTQDPVP